MTHLTSQSASGTILIVGGGPVGLSLAIELRGWGLCPVVVERREPEALTFPTANHLSVRTVEFLRRWGLASGLRESGFPPDWAGALSVLTHIGGYEIGHGHRRAASDPHRPAFSPETEMWQPKRFFDPYLRETAQERGVEFRFGTDVEILDQSETGISANLVNIETGESEHVVADYAVGCDGANSGVRDCMGGTLEGLPPQDSIDSVYFRSTKLMDLVPRDRWQYRLLGDAQGPDEIGWMLITIDGKEMWRLHGPGIIDLDDKNRTASNLRRLAGADIDIEILSMAPWRPRQAISSKFRAGRIFLAGDAAAVGTTFGGMWMNRGIADAVDLGWKLAANLRGWGGEALLNSYEFERRMATIDLLLFQGTDFSGQVPKKVQDRKFGHADALASPPPQLWQDDKEGEETRAIGQEMFAAKAAQRSEWPRADLGFRYDGSPVIIDDGTPFDNGIDWSLYKQTSKPGGRAPHVSISDGQSTLDWFKQGFTLIVSDGDPTNLLEAANETGVPMDVRRTRDPNVREFYAEPLTLVRPDGFVAWRGRSVDATEARHIIDQVRGAH